MSFFNSEDGKESSIENTTVVSTSTPRDSTITNTNISLQTSLTPVKSDNSWLIRPLDYFSMILKLSFPCYVVSSVFIGKQLIIQRCIILKLNITMIPNHYLNLSFLPTVCIIFLSDYMVHILLKNFADAHFAPIVA